MVFDEKKKPRVYARPHFYKYPELFHFFEFGIGDVFTAAGVCLLASVRPGAAGLAPLPL